MIAGFTDPLTFAAGGCTHVHGARDNRHWAGSAPAKGDSIHAKRNETMGVCGGGADAVRRGGVQADAD